MHSPLRASPNSTLSLPSSPPSSACSAPPSERHSSSLPHIVSALSALISAITLGSWWRKEWRLSRTTSRRRRCMTGRCSTSSALPSKSNLQSVCCWHSSSGSCTVWRADSRSIYSFLYLLYFFYFFSFSFACCCCSSSFDWLLYLFIKSHVYLSLPFFIWIIIVLPSNTVLSLPTSTLTKAERKLPRKLPRNPNKRDTHSFG